MYLVAKPAYVICTERYASAQNNQIAIYQFYIATIPKNGIVEYFQKRIE